MLTPASAATSLRRRPGTRRYPSTGSPSDCGVILARRVRRKSRTSVRMSTRATLGPGRPGGTSCWYTSAGASEGHGRLNDPGVSSSRRSGYRDSRMGRRGPSVPGGTHEDRDPEGHRPANGVWRRRRDGRPGSVGSATTWSYQSGAGEAASTPTTLRGRGSDHRQGVGVWKSDIVCQDQPAHL